MPAIKTPECRRARKNFEKEPTYKCVNFADNPDNTIKVWSGHAANGVPCSGYLSGLNSWSGNTKVGPLSLQLSVLVDDLRPEKEKERTRKIIDVASKAKDKKRAMASKRVKAAIDSELEWATANYNAHPECHEAVCKGCPFRPHLGHKCTNPECAHMNPPGPEVCQCCGANLGVCYINRDKGMRAQYLASKDKPVSSWDEIQRQIEIAVRYGGTKIFRYGSFGNMTMLGEDLLGRFGELARNHFKLHVVGYVADWMWYPKNHILTQYCMASVQVDPLDKKRQLAHSKGWHTYRAKLQGEALREGETLCFHESDCVQCMNCGRCGGQNGDQAITLHR